MQIAPSVHLTTATQPETSPWELTLRYAAATAATLVAIAAAQLVLATSFVVMLACITLAGVPVSLFLRRSDMRIGGVHVPRPLWNSLTVLSAVLMSTYYIFWTLRDFLLLMNTESAHALMLRFGPEHWVQLLMQVFLLFAAFRSFSLISDKDAMLATVPSFSVLLLLIPLHKEGVEVVIYFLVWSVVASLLFALDHRSDLRASATAFVPPLSPGQDARLAARSLAAVLGISLAASTGFSYFLTSRDASERSSAEDAINSLVSRLTSIALSLPEGTMNGGPERQIDFTSRPNLPSGALLWEGRAYTLEGRPIRPSYWRMFTLNTYNGHSWSQGVESAKRVQRTEVTPDRWPISPQFSNFPREDRRRSSRPSFGFNSYVSRGNGTRPFRSGFDIERAAPRLARQFGPPAVAVHQELRAQMTGISFVPVLPAPRVAMMRGSEQNEIRLRRDGGVDVGVVQAGQTVRFLSDVPPLPEYGISRAYVPSASVNAAHMSKPRVQLSPEARRAALQLPDGLPPRVSQLARLMLRDSPTRPTNYRRAQHLAQALQENAVYTLRPRTVPQGRDATDFFLFEGARRGYCTYFAGALAVLCRTQNIPARVVSGFYNTEWSDGGVGGSVQLREANSHAWTEVWVEGWGWAIVDATPPDDRGENSPTWLENWRDWAASQSEDLLALARENPYLVYALGIGLCLAIASRWVRGWRVLWLGRRAASDSDAERRLVVEIYGTTARCIARKFRPRASWETPDEWLQPFASTLSRPDAEALRRLTSLYLTARYTDRPLPRGSARLARETAAQIAWKQVKP